MPDVSPEDAPKVRLYRAGASGIRLTVALSLGRAFLSAVGAVALGVLVDRVVDGDSFSAAMAVMAAALAGRSLLAAFGPPVASSTANRVASDLRIRLLGAALRLGPWTGRRTGETVNKATEGVDSVGALAGSFLPQLIAGMAVPILLAAVVAAIDWPTALVLVVVLPLIPMLLRALERRFASVSARYRATSDRLAARFTDGIQGLTTLKVFDRADAYGDSIADEAEELRSETMRLLRVNQLALLAVDSLFTIGTIVAAATMAAVRLSNGAVTLGEAVTIVVLGVLLIEPIAQIGRFFYVGAIGRAAAKQIGRLLGSSSIGDPSPASVVDDDSRPGVVALERVSFTYPDGTLALDDVTLTIEPGERVALIGPSGSGKTTLAHVIVGLLLPQAGSMSAGGPVVLVPQRPYLFEGTVADNLRLADPAASTDRMWEVLERADLASTLRIRPDGLDTRVGERGLRLSGGEVQRLAIARALLVDAPVVVLDEPTSNIDLESEHRLRRSIDRLTEGRTVVTVAHRRSTISGMDRAIVLRDGRVAESVDGADALAALERSGRR